MSSSSIPFRILPLLFLCVVGLQATAVADESEYLDCMEKLAAQLEKRTGSLRAYTDLLAQVQDAGSAERVEGQLPAAAKELLADIKSTQSAALAFQAAEKKTPRRVLQQSENRERLEKLYQTLVKAEESLNSEGKRHLNEEVRIDKLIELPRSFWVAYELDRYRLFVANIELQIATRNGLEDRRLRFFRDLIAMMEKHGSERIVNISLTGSNEKHVAALRASLQKSFANLSILVLGGSAKSGHLMVVGPVERYDDVARAINFGKIIGQNPARHEIHIDVTASASSPSPPEDTVAVTDLGPDWPEMDQPSESDENWRKLGHDFMTRADIIKQYGRDRIAFVEVVNEGDLPFRPIAGRGRGPASNGLLGVTILSVVPQSEERFARSRGGRIMLGPVEDFDAFCKALDLGEIIERDDARKILKLSADQKKYFDRVGGVDIEILNYDAFKKRSEEVSRELDETMRAEGSPNRGPPLRGEFGSGLQRRAPSFTSRAMRESRDDPVKNLALLLKSAIEPDAARRSSYSQRGAKIKMSGALDFDAFCKDLDFAEIVDRDNVARSLKIRVDLEKLAGDEVVKRIGSGEDLASREKERLGLNAAGIARGLRRKADEKSNSPNQNDNSAPPNKDSDDAVDGYNRLVEMLTGDDIMQRRDAIRELLQLKPEDVPDKETRHRIARGFRDIAFGHHPFEKEDAIRGLVIWGGKHSAPLLIQLLEQERFRVPEALLDGLATYKDPKGAEAVCKLLGRIPSHDKAVSTLRKMGDVAEDALMKAAPSNDPKVSLAAIELLGDVGTNKSISLLTRAKQSRNPEIRSAADAAMQKIRGRSEKAAKETANATGNTP